MMGTKKVRSQSPGTKDDPIAIVGAACRLPSAPNLAAFWRLLVNEGDAIDTIPRERFDIDAWYDPVPGKAGKIVSREGGFLDDIDHFDAGFFGISPYEAIRLDPQCRLLLEVTWEALEDAGIPADRLAGSRTGVYAGCLTSSYWELIREAGAFDLHAAATVGGSGSAAAGRISYELDLRGPSMGVEAHCATSLLALHLSCRALWSGEIELAIVGGVNLLLAPDDYFALSEAGVLSPGGRSSFGDAGADGYVRSEGAVTVILKPLSKALADGDRVYATILGTASVNLGRSGDTFRTPGLSGQEQMLRVAYRDAGVSPGDIDYIETHGAGTAVGDRTELTALSQVLRDGRPPERPCLLGSVKSNIGHTEIAAGLAGLLKASFAVRHRTIPATLHVETPNPVLEEAGTPLELATTTRSWPRPGESALAGVSSFGLFGTNVHVVLTGAPDPVPARHQRRVLTTPHLLPISARHPDALTDLAGKYAERLSAARGGAEIYDVCHSAGARRTHHEHRMAVLGGSRQVIADGLRAFAAGRRPHPVVAAGQSAGPPRVVFVFPGQGSQWLGMGRELMATDSTFAELMAECSVAIEDELGWSLVDRLSDDTPFAEVDEIQPALWAMEVSLAGLWRNWGVEPDLVIGHSMGEIAAAATTGALTVRQAAAVVCRRSALLKELREPGAMWVVHLDERTAREAIGEFGGQVGVGVVNSSYSTVLSGDPDALAEVVAPLRRRGIFCKRVEVDYASHAPQVEPIRPGLLGALSDLRPRPGDIPIHSTALNRVIDGAELDADYWMENLRRVVRFESAVRHTLTDGIRTLFIEISPRPLLVSAIEDTIGALNADAAAVGSLQRERPELESLLASLGVAYVHGCAVEWAGVHPGGACTHLPAYPWQRKRYWFDSLDTGGADPGEPAYSLPDDAHELAELPAAAFAQHVANFVCDVLAMSPDDIDPNAPLTLAGLDSLLAAKLRTRLLEELNLRVDTKELLLARPFTEVTDELYDRAQVDHGPRP